MKEFIRCRFIDFFCSSLSFLLPLLWYWRGFYPYFLFYFSPFYIWLNPCHLVFVFYLYEIILCIFFYYQVFFLFLRNSILGLWSKDVNHVLLLEDCGVSQIPSENESQHASLIRDLYMFLDHNVSFIFSNQALHDLQSSLFFLAKLLDKVFCVMCIIVLWELIILSSWSSVWSAYAYFVCFYSIQYEFMYKKCCAVERMGTHS